MYPSQGGASPAGGFTHPPVSEGQQNIKQDKFSTDSGAIDSGFHSGQNFSSDNLFSSSSSAQVEAPVVAQYQSGSQKQHQQEEDSRTFDSGVDLSQQYHSGENQSTTPVDPMKVLCNDLGSLQLKSMEPPRIVTIHPDLMEKCFQQNEFGDTILHLILLRPPTPHITNKALALINAGGAYVGLLNIQNDEGQTPLHFAVMYFGQPNVIRALLFNGASPGIRDMDGNTPLHMACLRDYNGSASLLLNPPKQDLEQWNYSGKRCVHIAAERGNVEMLRLLVASGADINSREGTAGQTALHIAIEYEHQHVIDFLLDECPKLRLEKTTYAGLTAYQQAALLNNQPLLQRLKSRGAEPLTPPQSDYEDEDSEEDEQMSSYYGSNAFGSNFAGLPTINVA